MKTILLAGAGSVGKTELLKAIKQMATQRGLKVAVHLSTTRSSYERAGLANEGEQMARIEQGSEQDVQDMMTHQHQVMRDNCRALDETARACAIRDYKYDLLVADRTPYDYSTYFCTVFQPHITLEMIQAKRRQADVAIEKVILSSVDGVYLLYFPFPAPWSKDTGSSDGWRADKTGKNFIWSSLVNSELDEANRRFLSDSKWAASELPHFERLNAFAEHGLPEVRAAAVLGMVFPHLR